MKFATRLLIFIPILMLVLMNPAFAQVQNEEQQLQALFSAFLACWSQFQQLGPYVMSTQDQYVCGANMSNSHQALLFLSRTRDGLMKFTSYSDYTKQLARQVVTIIAPFTTSTATTGSPNLPSPGDDIFPGRTSADVIGGSDENYNNELGTQTQCTATGTCVDVPFGVSAGYDPSSGQIIELTAEEIPPGSGLVPLTPPPLPPD